MKKTLVAFALAASLSASDAFADSAKRSLPWYATAYAIDAGSTVLALQRPNTRELHPAGPQGVLMLKAVVAFGTWRLEAHLSSHGHAKAGRILRWIFVASSFAAGTWNLSLSF